MGTDSQSSNWLLKGVAAWGKTRALDTNDVRNYQDCVTFIATKCVGFFYTFH